MGSHGLADSQARELISKGVLEGTATLHISAVMDPSMVYQCCLVVELLLCFQVLFDSL